ncbi:MAG: hypothetical protein ACE5IW_05565 [bacterium]
MTIKQFRVFLSIILDLIVVSSLVASTPQIRTYQSQKEFEKGKPKGVSINSYGEISLAPRIDELFKSETPFLWSWAIDSQGNIFVGGGNNGQVLKIDSNGKATVFFESEELQVYALVVDKQNNLYVGTSPQGKVYKIPVNGNSTAENALFFDPEEIYIWSLAVDKQNNLYVATGEKGKIYKVDQKGHGTVFYESEDSHIRKMVFDKNGNLIIGTSSRGLVVRIDSHGKAFVLYDSPMAEITGLAVDREGNIYAAAVAEARIPSAPRRRPVPQPPTAREDVDKEPEEENVIELPVQNISAGGPPGVGRANSALYRIEVDGTVKNLWNTQTERLYSILLDNNENVVIGTGGRGRLYSMNAAGERTLSTELDEIQITALGKDSKQRIYLCTSNSGKVYRLAAEFSSKGEYISEVIDASVTSRWGSISWEADLYGHSELVFYTRSGNTEEPDKSWSPWSKAYTNSVGQPITSPPARFIQFKALLSTKDGKESPLLKKVSLAYLQKNVAPQILEITVHSPGDYFPESTNHVDFSSRLGEGDASNQNQVQNQYPGRKTFRKGFRSVSWKTQDDNGDQLSFSIFYKGEDQNSWKSLVENFKGFVYSWDSELLPDGRYLIKIVAKDDLSNPPAMTLATEKISQPFEVDNTGPEVTDFKVDAHGDETTISFLVVDEMRIVKSVEYGLNAEDWKLVYPIDGICDSKEERFELKLRTVPKGGNSLVIKAKDLIGNIGFGKKNFQL